MGKNCRIYVDTADGVNTENIAYAYSKKKKHTDKNGAPKMGRNGAPIVGENGAPSMGGNGAPGVG